MKKIRIHICAAAISMCAFPALADNAPDWHRTSLHSKTSDGEVLHLNIGGGGPNIIERWWNGKRVRWLDEGGHMKPDDLRGDLVNGVLQVDMDGDGIYDGPEDINIKWCDMDGDGIPDVQAFVINPKTWGPTKKNQTGHPVWMIFINHDQHGVLGWMDWQKFDFNCWDFTGTCNWLPNYHGNNDFVKTHAPAYALTDPSINWENPFSFYDEEGKGVANMAIRWCSPQLPRGTNVDIAPVVDYGFVTYDIDGNSGKDNESSFDMTLLGTGTRVDISHMVHPLSHFAGDPKFDSCFYHNEWRRLNELIYMDRDKGYETFFNTKWKFINFVFDEDGDDHRWERVELLNPTTNNHNAKGLPADIFSTARINNAEHLTPGLDGNPQSDSLGDRGEFDLNGSGGGKLYIGVFDRKFHLYGAKWGAWNVDKNSEFHGGVGEPTHRPTAKEVGEVVKYSDTDGDGYIDTIEYHYNGDRKTDFKVCLLDYQDKDGKIPSVVPVFDLGKLGWKGLHELFNTNAQAAWLEALEVYRAAWRRDLTTPDFDKMAMASTMMQRYQNSYWIKEEVFRAIRERLLERIATHPEETNKLHAFLANYVRAYYTGHFEEVVQLIESVPASEAK